MTTLHTLARLAGVLLVALLTTAPAAAQIPGLPDPRAAERPAPEVGQPYGKLHLPTVNGLQTRTLMGLRGQPVLLIEFASW